MSISQFIKNKCTENVYLVGNRCMIPKTVKELLQVLGCVDFCLNVINFSCLPEHITAYFESPINFLEYGWKFSSFYNTELITFFWD